MNQPQLIEALSDLLGDALISQSLNLGEVTCAIAPGHFADARAKLRIAPQNSTIQPRRPQC